MTRGQTYDPITAMHSLSLSPSPTCSRTFSYMLSPSPPVTAHVVPMLTPLPHGCAQHETEESLTASVKVYYGIEYWISTRADMFVKHPRTDTLLMWLQ